MTADNILFMISSNQVQIKQKYIYLCDRFHWGAFAFAEAEMIPVEPVQDNACEGTEAIQFSKFTNPL